jgi:hypothetical protein
MIDDAARGLRIVGASSRPRTGRRQQRFSRLIKEVARLKDAVRAWSQAQPELDRRVAACMRLGEDHRAALADLVRILDRHFPDRSLSRREREYLRELVCEVARGLLDADGPEDLKAIYNRHTRGDFDAEAAEAETLQARVMRSMLERAGFDFEGADIRTVDDLEAAAFARVGAVQAEAERRRAEAEAGARGAQRKRSAREKAAEVRREAERAQVSKALQEVYRKLAIALHPDLEQDPDERARKTAMMQQLNAAYERKDLLQLLELQLRLEQIDEAQIGSLAEDRLERYNRLLAEQVDQLEEELAELEAPWRAQLEIPSGRLTWAKVRTALDRDARELTSHIAQVRRDVQRLVDVRALKAWLRVELAAAQRAEPWADWR